MKRSMAEFPRYTDTDMQDEYRRGFLAGVLCCVLAAGVGFALWDVIGRLLS